MIAGEGGRIILRSDKETLVIEAWGANSLRVRATQLRDFFDEDLSPLLPPAETKPVIRTDGGAASIANGKLTCEILENGKLRFINQKGEILLEEYSRRRDHDIKTEPVSALDVNSRTYEPIPGTDNYRITVRFEASDGDRIYGMGQYQQPFLDCKGCIFELAHRNSQASVPFMLSSKGYGFLWNNPAIGKASFGKNLTEWISESSKKIDYWITAGNTPAEIAEAYAGVTGTAPMMPDFAMGFWQCKLRYVRQEEILAVAHKYKELNLPISVIVVDYCHWTKHGDWKFDPEYWPDPAGMVKELKDMGIGLMVSVWPTVERDSENYREMLDRGYLVRTEYGRRLGQVGNACFIDVTNPEARSYVWGKIKKNYYDLGIKVFWLDEAEPELEGYEYGNYRYFRGSELEIGNIYPREYARMFRDGMTAEKQENVINLIRCAAPGSQRYGALVWSGDIDSTFASLRSQVAAGLNIGLAGIPWWTTDIGGFHGGNIHDPAYRECFIRWFQSGAFCPVMRLHGGREPWVEGGHQDNEVWSYGEEVLAICRKHLELRESMRPYIKEQMRRAHEKGTPVIRPLFYDFPSDPAAWLIEDQYMFGDKYLVAPVLYENVRERDVYLPEGKWKDIDSGQIYSGGVTIRSEAPLDRIPVYYRQ
ncbi:MAG: glycoside hydrolase family 31 protein [Firmicutes bacterium]|nr:glycoside hydrolase family 31 protein [Bacillota bacterium]